MTHLLSSSLLAERHLLTQKSTPLGQLGLELRLLLAAQGGPLGLRRRRDLALGAVPEGQLGEAPAHLLALLAWCLAAGSAREGDQHGESDDERAGHGRWRTTPRWPGA
jgi:hypothetical protein